MDLEQIRAFANSLPATTEGIKWEDHLCFMVGEKMYLITGFEPESAVSIKVSDDEFGDLSVRPGILPAPYLARYKWVQIQDRSALSTKEWKDYITKSYELVRDKLPKKELQKAGLL